MNNTGRLLSAIMCLMMIIMTHMSYSKEQQDKGKNVDREIKRLPPSAFPELPENIAKVLNIRGYLIPQQTYTCHLAKSPTNKYYERFNKRHNVIKGEFARKGQTDWAILCSRNGESSIVIFWGGSPEQITEIAKSDDKHWVQGVGEEKSAYSRMINPVGNEWIMQYHKYFGRGAGLPPIEHQGIEDAFVGKASTIHYYYKNKWLTLAGAD